MVDIQEVRQANDRHRQTILRKPNVVGVGYGFKEVRGERTDRLCLVAMVRAKIPRAGLAPADLVPSELEGVSTDVIQVQNCFIFSFAFLCKVTENGQTRRSLPDRKNPS